MKRLFDLCVSLIGLTLLLPVFLVVAAAIWATSGRPVLFRQDRVGRGGRLFSLVKFRTMAVCDGADGTSITVRGDPRITPLGGFLRRTKLDELPQLWNVVRGDMSLVGPRPEVPEIVEGYSPEMFEIFSVRPGITSVASLLLSDEEGLLALATDSERAYREVLVPFKVGLGMEHVRRNSLPFEIGLLGRTAWRLTLGQVLKSEKDPRVQVLEERIRETGASGRG